MKESSTPYQIMASILKPHEKPSIEQAKTINTFFFCRWLSMNRHTTPISGVLNRFYNIPPETQLRFAQDYSDLTGMVNKVKFIGFNKEKNSPEMEKLLGNLERKFNISRTHAQEYFDLMKLSDEGAEQLDYIYTMYDTGLQK